MSKVRIKIFLFTLWGAIFALATVVGTIPGLLTFVFLGGALLDVRYLILAATFLTIGLTISFWLKKTLLIETPMVKG